VKILFQGGWWEGRNPPETRSVIETNCRSLAKYVVEQNHTVVLTSAKDYDKIIADEVSAIVRIQGKNIKDHLMFFLSQRDVLPKEGRVIRIPEKRWWIEERPYCVQNSDVLIAIGGGKGTLDCVEKALLSRKPVFVAASIPSDAAFAWKNRPSDYKYLIEGDSDVLDDVNIAPDEFFSHVFSIIHDLSAIVYSRRVLVVHGHNYHLRDTLADLLRKLEFEPVVLQDQASRSLTIIEKLERDAEKVGFAMILYSPDDFVRLPEGSEQGRSRQNVVFEHGLLIGLLGRERTCAIVHGDVEVPSDIHGMIYERVHDLKGEAVKIAKILKQAGYVVDASKLL